MAIQLTERQVEKYISDPGHCPKCGSEHIVGDFFQADGIIAWQTVECSGCGFTWDDEYDLTGISYDKDQ